MVSLVSTDILVYVLLLYSNSGQLSRDRADNCRSLPLPLAKKASVSLSIIDTDLKFENMSCMVYVVDTLDCKNMKSTHKCCLNILVKLYSGKCDNEYLLPSNKERRWVPPSLQTH